MREDSRPLGVVYTPPEVAGPMVRLVIDPLARGKSAAEILAIRVCDPAIGAGVFVLEVVNALADHLVAAWNRDPRAPGDVTGARHAPDAQDRATWPDVARHRIAATCIAGVDIDPAAVAATRAALTGARAPAPALDTDGRAFATREPATASLATGLEPTASALADSIQCGNALELDWRAAYPEVFARGGFDLVVGNPPYIRQEQLGGKAALEKFASYDGVADLYVYFVELAHQVLRPGGAYCLIIPNKWLTAAYGRPLRTFLAAQRSVDGIADLGRSPLFADADAFPCIVWGTTGRADDVGCSAPITAVRAEIGATVADVLASAIRDLRMAARSRGESRERLRWGDGPWHIDPPSERALLDRLERDLPPLGDIVRERPARGVVTGCNRAFVIDRATRDQILGEEPAAAALVRPFVKGRDISPWAVERTERWIILVDRGTSLDELPVVRAHLAQFRDALEPKPAGWVGAWRGRKPGTYAWHELQDPVGPLIKARAPRLLYQDIQTAPACALDLEGDAVPDTTVWMLPTADRFLLAVLSSPLYGWYAKRRFPPALNGAVRPKREYMRTLPIAQPDAGARHAIVDMVERRLAADRVDGPGLERSIASAVLDAYALSSAERRLLTTR